MELGIEFITSKFPKDDSKFLLKPVVTIPKAVSPDLPRNIVFIVDRSGSMKEHNRLNQAKKSLFAIIQQLQDNDTFSVIQFNDEANLLVENARKDDQVSIAAIESISANAGTVFSSGFAQVSRKLVPITRNTTILLITDGEDASKSKSVYYDIIATLSNIFKLNQADAVIIPKIIPIGVGKNFDDKLLSKIATRTRSQMLSIRDNSDMAAQVSVVFDQTQPRSEAVRITYADQHIDLGEIIFDQPFGQTVAINKSQLQNNDLKIQLKMGAEEQSAHCRIESDAQHAQYAHSISKVDYNLVADYVNSEVDRLLKDYLTKVGDSLKQDAPVGATVFMTMAFDNFHVEDSIDKEEREIRTQELLRNMTDLEVLFKDIEEAPSIYVRNTRSNLTKIVAALQKAKNIDRNTMTDTTNLLAQSYQTMSHFRTMVCDEYIGRKAPDLIFEGDVGAKPKANVPQDVHLINGDTDFIDLVKKSPIQDYLYIDAGVTNREVIVVRHNSEAVKNLYDHHTTSGISASLPLEDIIVSAAKTIHNWFLPSYQEKVEFDSFQKSDQLQKCELDEFITRKIGRCRHLSLSFALLLSRLINELNGSLIKTHVYIHRGTADNLNAHTWVIVEHGEKKYFIDVTNPQLELLDLHDAKDKAKLVGYYKQRDLHGILRTEGSQFTPLEKIPASVFDLINERVDQEEAMRGTVMFDEKSTFNYRVKQAGFICPISTEVMLDPVLAEDGLYYDRSCIARWFQNHNTSPMTNLPIGKKLSAAPQRRYDIYRFLVRELTQPENVFPSDKNQKSAEEANDSYQQRVEEKVGKIDISILQFSFYQRHNIAIRMSIIIGLAIVGVFVGALIFLALSGVFTAPAIIVGALIGKAVLCAIAGLIAGGALGALGPQIIHLIQRTMARLTNDLSKIKLAIKSSAAFANLTTQLESRDMKEKQQFVTQFDNANSTSALIKLLNPEGRRVEVDASADNVPLVGMPAKNANDRINFLEKARRHDLRKYLPDERSPEQSRELHM